MEENEKSKNLYHIERDFMKDINDDVDVSEAMGDVKYDREHDSDDDVDEADRELPTIADMNK